MRISEKTKRRFRYGTNAIVLTIVVIVVAILINVLLEQFPLSFDLTAQKKYSLTDDSKKLLSEIEKEGKEIEIIALFDRVRGEANKNQSVVIKMLDKYDAFKNVSVKYVDTDRNPAFVVNTVGQERASDYSNGDYIVKHDDNIKRIAGSDMYLRQFDAMTLSQTLVGYAIEKSLTSSILHVTSDYIPKIYISTGFGEASKDAYSSLFDNIQYLNFDIDTINLTKDEIPEDAKIIFFIGPKKDLSAMAYDNLSKWFDEGGHHGIFMMDYDMSGTDLANFNKLFDRFNLKINNDIVFESDKHYINNMPRRFEATTKTAGSLSKIREQAVLVFETRSIELLSRTNDYIKADAIIVSSNDAKAVPIVEDSDAFDEEKGVKGISILAATSTYLSAKDSSRILLTGSSLNVRDDYVSAYGSGAGSIVLYTLQWMYSALNEGNYIPTVSVSSGEAIGVSNRAMYVLGFFAIIFWPLCILLVGIVIWARRRHL